MVFSFQPPAALCLPKIDSRGSWHNLLTTHTLLLVRRVGLESIQQMHALCNETKCHIIAPMWKISKSHTSHPQPFSSLIWEKHLCSLSCFKSCSLFHRIFPLLKVLQKAVFQPLGKNGWKYYNYKLAVHILRHCIIILLTDSRGSFGSLYGLRSGFRFKILSLVDRTFKQSKNLSKFLMKSQVSVVLLSPRCTRAHATVELETYMYMYIAL